MALNNKVFNSHKTSLSHDELLKIFHDLYNEPKMIDRKYNLLKMNHISLTNKFDVLKNKYGKYILTYCTSL